MINEFLLLLGKDFKLEIKRLDSFILHLTISILLLVISVVGINSAFISLDITRKLYPVFIWIIFIFTASITLGKSLEQELEENAFNSLLLFNVNPSLIYLSKVFVNFTLIYFVHIISSCLLLIFFNINLSNVFALYLLVSALVVFAYSSLSTLLSAISSFSKLKGLLLPIILLPLLFPVLFAALELSSEIVVNSEFDIANIWVSLLIILNVIYIALGINLYEFAIKD